MFLLAVRYIIVVIFFRAGQKLNIIQTDVRMYLNICFVDPICYLNSLSMSLAQPWLEGRSASALTLRQHWPNCSWTALSHQSTLNWVVLYYNYWHIKQGQTVEIGDSVLLFCIADWYFQNEHKNKNALNIWFKITQTTLGARSNWFVLVPTFPMLAQ